MRICLMSNLPNFIPIQFEELKLTVKEGHPTRTTTRWLRILDQFLIQNQS